MARHTHWLRMGLLIGLFAAGCGAPNDPALTATYTVLATHTPTPTATAAPPTPTPGFVPDLPGVRPPTAELTINGQSQTSAIGTYCWNSEPDANGNVTGLCADMIGVITPRLALVLPEGPFTAQFALPLDQPGSADLWVYAAPGEPLYNAATDTLGWQPFDDGRRYPIPTVQNPSAALDLPPGLYIIALFAQWADQGDVMYGYLVQVGAIQPTPTPAAATDELPASCEADGAGNLTFVEVGRHYCLLYPNTFSLGEITTNRADFYGPPLDASVEPVRATLTIEILGPDGGQSLAAVVDDYIAANGADLPITREPSQWGGEPATVLYGLPGREATRQAIVLHGGTIYHIVLLPYDVNALPALADVENVWAVASQSFSFLGSP